MNANVLLGILLGVFAVACCGFLFATMNSRRRGPQLRNLMGSGGTEVNKEVQALREAMEADESGDMQESFRKEFRKRGKGKEVVTLEERLFQAGYFSDTQKRDFKRMRVLLPAVSSVIGLVLGISGGSTDMILLGGVGGFIFGIYLPMKILDRRVHHRGEDILYYLPLVIEQISIGVSSSLDIGPCLQKVVDMADERDSHNPVTELIRYAHNHVKSGASLDDAMTEIGKLSGHTELKHAFMSLAQVARHGGEISRQLQELADSVAAQRETKIEGKIKRLELEATGPVALVFMGFLVILLIGFGIQIKGAF